MPRLLILANRLPITLRSLAGNVSVVPSTGGLATALRVLHAQNDGLWIGWPGEVSSCSRDRPDLRTRLEELRAVPVHLDATEVSRYYEGFSNGTLWPLLHNFVEKVELDSSDAFETYAAINARFADIAAERYLPGDVVWVHDYHLMLAAEALRKKLPKAKIGFFLHTPFPPPEVFRILPYRERLIRGLLGADLLGFQTHAHRANFAQTMACTVGVEPARNVAVYEGRTVTLGVYPIGVDAAVLGDLATSTTTLEEARRIRQEAPGRIVLSVDRLDYTKGILRRLDAVERFLSRASHTSHAPRVRFVQVAAPTREGVLAYAQTSREVEERVNRINGRHRDHGAPPIQLLHRAVPLEGLAALYASADVMLVTPLCDGMNLVAKEYVAMRSDLTGTLVLSEFTGASIDLAEALVVNPYDVAAVAAAIARALSMAPDEQRLRMSALRRAVLQNDVHRWARSFLDDLGRGAPSMACGAPRIHRTQRLPGRARRMGPLATR